MFKFRKIPQINPPKSTKDRDVCLDLLPDLSLRLEDLDRRESALNARLAAFEALLRRRTEDLGGSSRVSQEDLSIIEQRTNKLEEIAEALEAREKRMAELASNLRAREIALAQRTRALQSSEKELSRKRAEAEKIQMSLKAVQSEIDEKERLFEERSRRALETIRQQKDELQQLRKAA